MSFVLFILQYLKVFPARANFSLAIAATDNNRIGRATTGGCPYKSDSFLRTAPVVISSNYDPIALSPSKGAVKFPNPNLSFYVNFVSFVVIIPNSSFAPFAFPSTTLRACFAANLFSSSVAALPHYSAGPISSRPKNSVTSGQVRSARYGW